MPRERKAGSIYPIKYETRKKLGDGSVRVYTGYHARVDGRWVSAKTYKECNEKIREAMREKVTWGASMNHSAKLGPYVREWYEMYRQNLDPSTRISYESIVYRHLKPYENVSMSDLTPSALNRIIDRMTTVDGKEASVGTKMNLRKILRMVLDAAVADRIIPANPMRVVKPKKGKDREVRVRPHEPFTEPQVMSILQEASKDLRSGAIQWWRILTGMRQGEILGATLEDLDLIETSPGIWEGYYTVNWQLIRIRRLHGCGKPDDDGHYPCGQKLRGAARCTNPIWDVPVGFDFTPLEGPHCLARPKTDNGRRIVPIIPQLGTVVHRYLELVRDEPNPYGLIFHQPDGKPLERAKDLAGFRDLLGRAGVPNPEKRYGHDCRNSAISLMFSAGVDPGKIRRIFGHSSIVMSEYYRRVPKEELLSSMRGMGDELDFKQLDWRG